MSREWAWQMALTAAGCAVGSLVGGWVGTRLAQGCPVWPW